MVMSLKHGLLGLLNYGSMTGYELDKTFNDSLGFFWQGKTSQIYRELNALETSGWLVSERVVQEDKPNKKIYSVTDDGKKELIAWLSDSSITEACTKIRSGFLMRVFFAGETKPENAIMLIRQFRDACLSELEKMKSIPQSVIEYGTVVGDDATVVYWQLTALFGEHYYKAGLDWANEALAALGDGK
jgi:DNA-binding PadR family transcriptional regulator